MTMQSHTCHVRWSGIRWSSKHARLRNGVATQIQVEVPSAIPVYCLAHCLQLVLREKGRKYRSLREALETVAFSAVLEDYVSADNGRYKRHHTRRVWKEGK